MMQLSVRHCVLPLCLLIIYGLCPGCGSAPSPSPTPAAADDADNAMNLELVDEDQPEVADTPVVDEPEDTADVEVAGFVSDLEGAWTGDVETVQTASIAGMPAQEETTTAAATVEIGANGTSLSGASLGDQAAASGSAPLETGQTVSWINTREDETAETWTMTVREYEATEATTHAVIEIVMEADNGEGMTIQVEQDYALDGDQLEYREVQQQETYLNDQLLASVELVKTGTLDRE